MKKLKFKKIPREYTEEEVRDKFLSHIKGLVDYWYNVDEGATYNSLDGLAFSILSTIDGGNLNMPGFILAPLPCEEDKDYHINECHENYFPQNHKSNVKCDIAGGLHEIYAMKYKK